MHQLASEAEIFHSHPSCLNCQNAIGITAVATEGSHRYTPIHAHTRALTDMLNIAFILCIVSMWQIIMALIFLCKYMCTVLCSPYLGIREIQSACLASVAGGRAGHVFINTIMTATGVGHKHDFNPLVKPCRKYIYTQKNFFELQNSADLRNIPTCMLYLKATK